MDNYNSNNKTPWALYKTKITKIIIKKGITNIGTNVFDIYPILKEVESLYIEAINMRFFENS